MTWLKVCRYMYSLTSIDIRPFLDLKIEAGLISLYKNRGKGNYRFNSLSLFLSKEADIEYCSLKRLSTNVSNNRFVLAQKQP